MEGKYLDGRLNISVLAAALIVSFSGCTEVHSGDATAAGGPDGPASQGIPVPQQRGNASAGKDVFRNETFGNERFWTDAVRLPQGIAAARVTPNQALRLGLSVDLLKVPLPITLGVAAQLLVNHDGTKSSILNNPDVTIKLINANAVIGFSAKDSNGDGRIDILHGDKVGATCALCHTRTGFAVLNVPGGGSIGFRKDGPATHNLDFGSLAALGQNSRALYPMLELALRAHGGKALGRAPIGLTEESTEADVDAYLTNKNYYPVGMFDDSVDGNGDPTHNAPLFRQDLAGPYGTEGSISTQDNFANLVYTALLDPTNLTTPGGRAFLVKLGGAAAGNEIVDNYIKVLADTDVTGYPYVVASPPGDSSLAGTESYPLGVRVDNKKLVDLNAYLFGLQAPHGHVGDTAAVSRGRTLFRSGSCTGCHNVDQGRPVPAFIVPMANIFPGDVPDVLLAHRDPPLNPILDTPGNIFDDKMAVVNASLRGLERGIALPLLLDLSSKPAFLHDNSVPSMEALFNPARGASMPHPFYISDARQRDDIVAYLKSLDTKSH